MSKHQNPPEEASKDNNNNNNNNDHQPPNYRIIEGDSLNVLTSLSNNSIDCCFTSPEPPYNTQEMQKLIAVMLAVYPVIKPQGSIWVHLADVHDVKGNMALIPERFALEMTTRHGWHLRNKLIWYRPSDTECPDQTRFKRDWEYLFWFVKKNPGYYFDGHCHIDDSSVKQYEYKQPNPYEFDSGFPIDLITDALVVTCPEHGIVIDPFTGTGSTGAAALECHFSFVGIEIKHDLIEKINDRLYNVQTNL